MCCCKPAASTRSYSHFSTSPLSRISRGACSRASDGQNRGRLLGCLHLVLHGGGQRGGAVVGGGEVDLRPAGPLHRRSPSPAGFETSLTQHHHSLRKNCGHLVHEARLFHGELSLYSESSSYHDKKDVPRLTIPNPFNLDTDERGHDKERQLEAQLLQKKLEEEKARKFKAIPYPYTTDYPVVPPKPEPKPCTRPEGFQLESLVRHEVEQQKLMEERERI
ncbi:hypothetical protein QYE76_000398 [Lolium multiflorum]|uniref:Uncharacterized protein n=1 Tax=Lolium multiflorum TaxID=4521 RepID=A0AAD8RHQ5_LOLMU|nr:hypothetical protein QYE76_000398 [Lolium multiflorum]